MIHAISSYDLNKKMEEADALIDSVKKDLNTIEQDIVNKMLVIQNEQQYVQHLSNQVLSMAASNVYDKNRNKVLFAGREALTGEFEQYGISIHPKFIRTPANLLNIHTASGVLFRNNASVLINEEISARAKQMLMHDNVKNKGIYFEEFESNRVKLQVDLHADSLGDGHFNCIEIDPYLAGSFSIEEIRIKEKHSSEFKKIDLSYARTERMRIVLDKKYELGSIQFTLKLLFKNNIDRYPFGLQSLAFLNADFDLNSYVVATLKKSEFIESIGSRIVLTGSKAATTSLYAEKIRLYLDKKDNNLLNEIVFMHEDMLYALSVNTTTVYAYIPLEKQASLTSIDFMQIQSRIKN